MSYNAKEYWNNLLKKSCNDAGVCWPQWPLSYNKWLHEQQKNGFETILNTHNITLSNKRIFEIGIGNGFWSDIIVAKGCVDYRGFDIAEASICKLQLKYPQYSFTECDFARYSPHKDEKKQFDVALCVQVFLHMTKNNKFEESFKNVSSMLKEDGIFIVLDAVAQNRLQGKQQKMADGEWFDIRYHNKVRYMDYYVSVGSKNGLELVASYPAFNITQNTFDFKSKVGFTIGNFYFKYILNLLLVHSNERLGYLIGKLLVKIDQSFFAKKSYSSKWLVFRKSR